MTVSLVVNLGGNGMTIEEITKEYPDLEREDILQAIEYSARLTKSRGGPCRENLS